MWPRRWRSRPPVTRWESRPACQRSCGLTAWRTGCARCINLVDNAIKYGDSRASIRISGMERNGFVWLFVRNRGKGLAPQEQERIFEPFYRVDKAYSREQGSSGLGLSICRKIIEEHEGLIGVKSKPESQTVFYIRLQKTVISRQLQEERKEAPHAPRKTEPKKERPLL